MNTSINLATIDPGVAPLPTQYLTFLLGQERFAVGILHVKEIIEYAGTASVPMMPDCVRGVINLRGAVVPVIDLSARFGRGVATLGKRTSIIIAEVEDGDGQGKQVLGMMVDAVNAVVEIEAADIEPAPPFGARIRADFIAGIAKCHGRFVILLALERVLSTGEVVALSRHAAPMVLAGSSSSSSTSSSPNTSTSTSTSA